MIKFNETYSINNGQESIVFKKGNGNTITGVYNDGTLTGTMEGNLLKATFHNKKSNGAGLIEFTFNANGFDCKWKQGLEPGPMRGKWTGKLDDAAATKAAKTPAPKQEPITAPKETPKPKEVEKVVSKPTLVQQEDQEETHEYEVTVRIDNNYKRKKKTEQFELDEDWYREMGHWKLNYLPFMNQSKTTKFSCFVIGNKGSLIKLNKNIVQTLIYDMMNPFDIGNCCICLKNYSKDKNAIEYAVRRNNASDKPYFKLTILSITKV